MEAYGDTMAPIPDFHPGLFPSTLDSGDCFAPHEGGLDFLWAPHEYWPQGVPFWQDNSCLNNIDLASIPYDTTTSCNTQLSNAPATDTKKVASTVDTPDPETSESRKRKRNSSLKPTSRKQAKTATRRSTSPRNSTGDVSVTPAPSSRAHYAVEKRYRSTLNERYATLARILSQPETQEICRTVCEDYEMPTKLDVGSGSSNGEKDSPRRQSKTTTLSAAIDAIALLDRACANKAKEFQSLVCRLNRIVQATGVDLTECKKK